MKLLVVDDEADVSLLFRQRFRKELKSGQLEMGFALSGMAALEYLDTHGTTGCKLILSDINMPGMTGIELLKILKQRYPNLKVFMITAYGDEVNHASAIDSGADDYFTKPIEFELLKARMRELEPL